MAVEVISLWHCWGGMKTRFLWQWPSAHLHFLVSCFSFSSWQYPIDSLLGSGLVSLLASQAHQHHGHLTNFWCFWQREQVPNPAGKWNCSQIPWHVCVWWLLMPWPQPQSIPCEVHPNSWIDLAWQSSKGCGSRCWLCIFFFHTFSFHSTFC